VPLKLGVCAGHGTELVRCKSSQQVFAEPKIRRRARASLRGGGIRDALNLLTLEALQHLVARDIESRKISRIGWDTF
jgi:hypothetical protein